MSQAEEIIVGLVRDGFFRIAPDGSIWRSQAFGRTGKRRRIPERRADTRRRDGYFQVQVQIDGIDYRALSHRIVFICTKGPIPDGLSINHENGVKIDNRQENLSAMTHAENVRHGWEVLGREPTAGEANGRARLTESQVAEIRRLYSAGGHSHRSLGRQFGVTHNQIGLIVRGERWSEFPA